MFRARWLVEASDFPRRARGCTRTGFGGRYVGRGGEKSIRTRIKGGKVRAGGRDRFQGSEGYNKKKIFIRCKFAKEVCRDVARPWHRPRGCRPSWQQIGKHTDQNNDFPLLFPEVRAHSTSGPFDPYSLYTRRTDRIRRFPYDLGAIERT